MAQNRESYSLGRSQPFDLSTGAEDRSDLILSPSADLNKSSIVTVVTDGTNPIVNALVKVLTPGGDPVDHQYTNSIGHSISTPLTTGIYDVVVSAPGFLTSQPVSVNLPAVTTYFLDVTLSVDPRAALNTLYGLVLDHNTGNRIAGATAILTDTAGQTVATTQTNADGEYLLSQIDNGTYELTATKTGYQLQNPITVIVSGGQIAQTDITLTAEVALEGTVQGFIKDESGSFLGGASVGLYSISGTVETLVMSTYANANGFYLFGNVPSGTYLVKSNVETLV